jgi:hypothetical protein
MMMLLSRKREIKPWRVNMIFLEKMTFLLYQNMEKEKLKKVRKDRVKKGKLK